MEVSEEEEFGLAKLTTRENDPIEQEIGSVHTHQQPLQQDPPEEAKEQDPQEEEEVCLEPHEDFRLVQPLELKTKRNEFPAWMQSAPIHNEPARWIIMEAQIRPDISWQLVQELITNVCMERGLVLEESKPSSLLFTKPLENLVESAADLSAVASSATTGLASSRTSPPSSPSSRSSNAAGASAIGALVPTHENAFVHIGVTPWKMRVVYFCCCYSGDLKLLPGIVLPSSRTATCAENAVLQQELFGLLRAFQYALIGNNLSLKGLHDHSPENQFLKDGQVSLDPEYVTEVKRIFVSEMKENMRDLCIPLEEFAYEQEYGCAALITILDPMFKKYKLTVPTLVNDSSDSLQSSISASQADESSAPQPLPARQDCNRRSSLDQNPPSSQDETAVGITQEQYAARINELVLCLRRDIEKSCETKVRQKAEEKKRQVSIRADNVKKMRHQVVRSVMMAEHADVSSFRLSTGAPDEPHRIEDVLLYEGTSVINNLPYRLHVTYGALLYRSVVSWFNSTTNTVDFRDVLKVRRSTVLGIHAVVLDLRNGKTFTLTMGMDMDLLFELLQEIVEMHLEEAQDQAQTLVQDSTRAQARVE